MREETIRLSTSGPRVPTSSQMKEKGKWVVDSGKEIHTKLDSEWTAPEKMIGTKARLGRKLDMPIFCGENPEVECSELNDSFILINSLRKS